MPRFCRSGRAKGDTLKSILEAQGVSPDIRSGDVWSIEEGSPRGNQLLQTLRVVTTGAWQTIIANVMDKCIAAASSYLKTLESDELNWMPKHAEAIQAWILNANSFLCAVVGMESPGARSTHITMDAKSCEAKSIMQEYDIITRPLVGSRGQTKCDLDTAFMIHAQH